MIDFDVVLEELLLLRIKRRNQYELVCVLLDFSKKRYLEFKQFNILIRNINSKKNYGFNFIKQLFNREADLQADENMKKLITYKRLAIVCERFGLLSIDAQ